MNKEEALTHLATIDALVYLTTHREPGLDDREKIMTALEGLSKAAETDDWMKKRVGWVRELVSLSSLYSRRPVPKSERGLTNRQEILEEVKKIQFHVGQLPDEL